MSSRDAEPPHGARLRSRRELRFFLARAREAGRVELLPGEAEHASRVLRLGPGDRVVGLDGRGGAWPLAVVALERGQVVLEPDGPPRQEPAPGEPGAALPWIELSVPWPKGGRAEEMVDRLTQLGAAGFGPLETERAGPAAGELSEPRRARFERVLRETCKQCGQLWLPRLRDRVGFDAAQADGTAVFLDPASRTSLAAWARERNDRGEAHWTSSKPLRVFVGPEGGFTDGERAELAANGAAAVTLGPFVLRVETAAEAAMAVLAATLVKDPGS